MRIKEFALLLEDEIDHVAMDQLIDTALDTANDGPKQAEKTVSVLKSLINKLTQTIKNYSSTVETPPEQQPKQDEEPPPALTYEPELEPMPEPSEEPQIKESLGDIEIVKDQLVIINQLKDEANKSPAVLALIDQLIEQHTKQLEEVRAQSHRAGVQVGRQQVHAEHATLDQHIDFMLQRMSVEKRKKKLLIASIKSIFQHDQISTEDAIKFLEAAAEGKVIDMTQLLKDKKGNITDYVRPDLVSTFKKVIDDFFKLDLGASTGGNIGPGEIAFILLGNPVAKVKKGDLKIGEGDDAVKFEVKASGLKKGKDSDSDSPTGSPSGSVFGGDHISTGAALWPTIKNVFEKYEITHTEETVIDKSGKEKQSPMYRLNGKGFGQFNAAFEKLDLEKRAGLLADIALTLYPGTTTEDTCKKTITKILEKNDGLLEENVNNDYMRYLSLLALRAYRRDEGKENFIYFNQVTKNFEIYFGDELDQEIKSPKSKLAVVRGIDWNDGHYKASPGLYLK